MSSWTRHLSPLRRAAIVSLLVAAPLMPLTACGDESGNGGDSDVENEEQGDRKDDGGVY